MRIVCLIAGIALASCAAENPASAPANSALAGVSDPLRVAEIAQGQVREMVENPEGIELFTQTEVYPGRGGIWIVCGLYYRDDDAYRYVFVDGAEIYFEPRHDAARLDRACAEHCPPM